MSDITSFFKVVSKDYECLIDNIDYYSNSSNISDEFVQKDHICQPICGVLNKIRKKYLIWKMKHLLFQNQSIKQLTNVENSNDFMYKYLLTEQVEQLYKCLNGKYDGCILLGSQFYPNVKTIVESAYSLKKNTQTLNVCQIPSICQGLCLNITHWAIIDNRVANNDHPVVYHNLYIINHSLSISTTTNSKNSFIYGSLWRKRKLVSTCNPIIFNQNFYAYKFFNCSFINNHKLKLARQNNDLKAGFIGIHRHISSSINSHCSIWLFNLTSLPIYFDTILDCDCVQSLKAIKSEMNKLIDSELHINSTRRKANNNSLSIWTRSKSYGKRCCSIKLEPGHCYELFECSKLRSCFHKINTSQTNIRSNAVQTFCSMPTIYIGTNCWGQTERRLHVIDCHKWLFLSLNDMYCDLKH